MILIDTREKPKAISKIIKYFDDNKIEYDSSKLYVGDYQNLDNPKVVVDRKQNLSEIMQNITQKRFKEELIRAKKAGIHLIILIEHSKDIKSIEDVEKWRNPRLDYYCLTLKKQLGLWGSYNEWYLYNAAKEKGLSPRRPPQNSTQLMKSLITIQNNKEDYDCEFQFCDKSQTGFIIYKLLCTEQLSLDNFL